MAETKEAKTSSRKALIAHLKRDGYQVQVKSAKLSESEWAQDLKRTFDALHRALKVHPHLISYRLQEDVCSPEYFDPPGTVSPGPRGWGGCTGPTFDGDPGYSSFHIPDRARGLCLEFIIHHPESDGKDMVERLREVTKLDTKKSETGPVWLNCDAISGKEEVFQFAAKPGLTEALAALRKLVPQLTETDLMRCQFPLHPPPEHSNEREDDGLGDWFGDQPRKKTGFTKNGTYGYNELLCDKVKTTIAHGDCHYIKITMSHDDAIAYGPDLAQALLS